MNNTKKERYYVVGYIGSDRLSKGRELAEKFSCPMLVTDDEIERLDGRNIKRVVMIHGEHSYRNMEYELLAKLENDAYDHGLAKNEEYPDKLVVVCGDGIVLDEMCLDILKVSNTYFVNEDPEILWERAHNDTSVPYFFMANDDMEEKKKAFFEFHKLRLPLYLEASGGKSE